MIVQPARAVEAPLANWMVLPSGIAADYDKRYAQGLGQLERQFKESEAFIAAKPGGRLLDYACGTGLVSRSLAPPIAECIGVDVSEKMIEAYNAKAKTEVRIIPLFMGRGLRQPPAFASAIDVGLWPHKRQAFLGDLTNPSDPSPAGFAGPEFWDFDIAGVGAGFHHFEDCDLAAKRLVERLRPGGVLFILDFLPHEADFSGGHAGDHGSHHGAAQHGVKHLGFSHEKVKAMFEGAGAGVDFGFKVLEEELVFRRDNGSEMRRKVFLARGNKG
ncbi:hypothetical protein S40288_02026 [Stachybotrys chartarum IBT 40288]|nr:hypothetical protein S40288_02026 [Stachybotrys chartarum IBT 40288]